MAQLPPVPQPIGIFPTFTARQTEAIVLREKTFSLSGDSFEIRLASGHPILKVQGSVMSLSGRKSVYDMAGTHLFDITKEHLRLHATYAVSDPSGQRLMEVKSGFALMGSKATATFTSANGKPETLRMKGSMLDTSADIIDESNGAVVARIQRQLSGRDMFFGQQTYTVIIAPGVDMALMAALCICLDEKNNDQ